MWSQKSENKWDEMCSFFKWAHFRSGCMASYIQLPENRNLLPLRVSQRTSRFPRPNMWATSRTTREPRSWAVSSTPAFLTQSFLLLSRSRRRCVCAFLHLNQIFNIWTLPFLFMSHNLSVHPRLSPSDHQEADREEAGSDPKSLSRAFLF